MRSFQPIVSLLTLQVVAFEATVHWERMDGRLALPDELTEAAQDTELIVSIGTWAVREAVRQVARWNEASPDLAPLTIAVPVTSRQVVTSPLATDVAHVLEHEPVDPSWLVLEVHESVFTSVRHLL